MHYLQTEFVYNRRGLFKSIFYGFKNPKRYGSFKEVGVFYDFLVNSDKVVYYDFPEQLVETGTFFYDFPVFRTTTGIQSRPDVLDKSRFVMTFLTILGLMEILLSFTLGLEGKTGKEIPES